MNTSDGRRRTQDLAVFLYLPFAALVLLTWSHTPDDAFITLRYAANILHGHGAVFNIGEHVQGFSSPLHLLLMVGNVAVPGGHALLAAKLASVVFGVLALQVGSQLVRYLDLPRWAERTAFVLLGTSYVMAVSSTNGLETTLAAWLTTLLIWRLVQGLGSRAPWRTGCVAFLAVLARPDATLLIAVLAAVALFVDPAERWTRRALWALGGAAAVATTLLASFLYYHDPLPNTYYAKNAGVGQSLKAGLQYLAHSLQPGAGLHPLLPFLTYVLFAVQLLLLCFGVYSILACDRALVYLPAAVAGQSLFILKSGGDWMVGARFLAPVMIPIIVVEILGLVSLVRWFEARSRSATHVSTGVALSLVVVASLLPLRSVVAPIWQSGWRFDDTSLIRADSHVLSQAWADLPMLTRCIPEGASIATSEIGHLGYARQDLTIIDAVGLTDRTIAKDTPASLKNFTGVFADYTNPSTVSGQRVIVTNPGFVVDVLYPDDLLVPSSILDGRYRLGRIARRSSAYEIAIFARSDERSRPCG